jgi:transcriptional regulator GlxA family with amidase domain
MAKRKQVRIGVFMPNTVQLLDFASVDAMYMAGHTYLAGLPLVPKPVAEIAPDVIIKYISSPGVEKLTLTSDITVVPTHDFTDPAVAPGTLDIVHVPGPDPWSERDSKATAWLAAQAKHPGVEIISVCTGIFVCGEAGLLKGKTASGPRGLQDEIKKRFEGVKLVGDEYRWVRDGNFWSSGESMPPRDANPSRVRAVDECWRG